MANRRKGKAGSSRREFVALAATAGAGAMLMPLAKALGEARADSYVLLLVADSLRADRLGCYGYKRMVDGARQSITPVLDSLAEKGVLYENCIAQANWTQTSMASLLYSAWPVIKGDKHTFDYVPEGFEALAGALPGFRRVGIHTNPYLTSKVYSEQFEPYKFVKYKEYAPAKRMNDEFDWEVANLAHDGRSFFAYVHYMEPHEPYNYEHRFRGKFAPEGWGYIHPTELNSKLVPYRDDTGRVTSEVPYELSARIAGTSDAYDEDVMEFDASLEGLLKLLKMYGIEDRTTVIIASDHGQGFGEHGWVGHKVTLYQEETHVPLIMFGPGIPKGARVKAAVRNVDILPTIAALSGTSVRGLVGAPLLPVERVEAAGNRIAYTCSDYAMYGKIWRLLTGLVTPDRMKYIRVLTQEHELLREELYDLAADPAEATDLSETRAEDLKALSAKMDEFEAAAFWRESTGGEATIDKQHEEQLRALGYTGK